MKQVFIKEQLQKLPRKSETADKSSKKYIFSVSVDFWFEQDRWKLQISFKTNFEFSLRAIFE